MNIANSKNRCQITLEIISNFMDLSQLSKCGGNSTIHNVDVGW